MLNAEGRPMPYRNLGGTGLMVSALSFGANSHLGAVYRVIQTDQTMIDQTPLHIVRS
jgi:aryl-alcohol dehydrogenase-like predicted oxidoreductase